MSDEQIKELCLQLMRADSEMQVIELLQLNNYWRNDAYWRYYGDTEQNYSSAGNQADEAEAAFVEKIINSRDAILLNECRKRGIDPESSEAPKSVKEAVALFFEENHLVN